MLEIFWDNLYHEAWQFWNRKLGRLIPQINMDEWDGADPVYGVLHEGIVTPCAWNMDPAHIPQNPGYLTVFRSEDCHPDNPKEFEQVLLEVSGLREEYLAVFRFLSSYVLFPVPLTVTEELLGSVITNKFRQEFTQLDLESDPAEWKLLTKDTMKQFVSDHQWLLDKIGDRILENMLLQGLIRND